MKKKTIRELRTENRYTVQQIADKTGIPFSTYTAIELGYRKCSLEVLEKLAAFYGLKMDDIDYKN
jgi:transcriptional regulator with XRE-family HTH domain